MAFELINTVCPWAEYADAELHAARAHLEAVRVELRCRLGDVEYSLKAIVAEMERRRYGL